MTPREPLPRVGSFRVTAVGNRGMTTAAVRGVVRQLGGPADPTDADLVVAFAARRDPDAFAELLRRHGPVVLGACRRILSDAHAAEDAFQAVFLALVRSAPNIRDGRAIPAWLHGVAVRIATRASPRGTRVRAPPPTATSRPGRTAPPRRGPPPAASRVRRR